MTNDVDMVMLTPADGDMADVVRDERVILKLKKPFEFGGQTYTEVDLSGLELITAKDLTVVGKIMTSIGVVVPNPEMSIPYAVYMAARVSGLPVEFFMSLPAGDAIRLKNIVTGFLYGGDGEE